MTDSPSIRFLSGGHVARCQAWIEPRRFTYRSINWVRRGSLLWRGQNGQWRCLTAPLLFWTWPGPVFSYGVIEDQSWDQSWISFQGGAADRLVRRLNIPMLADRNFCRPIEPEYVSQTFDRLLDALAQPVRPIDRMMNLLESLGLMVRESGGAIGLAEETDRERPKENALRPNPVSARQDLALHLRILTKNIQTDPGRDWHWPGQAERLCISLIHFRRTFQRQAGLPPQQYLIHCRMKAAAEMLAHSRQPVKTIAMAVGYGDVIHFTKTFGRHHGLTPTAYRREMEHYTGHG